MSKISLICSGMSIRPEIASLSWSLFRLSAFQIQIGQVVKSLRDAIGSSSMIQSSSSINSIMCFRFLESKTHGFDWKLQCLADPIYHMMYFTVAHSIRHGSPQSSESLTTTYVIISGFMLDGHLHHWEPEELSGIKLLNGATTFVNKLKDIFDCHRSRMRS